ncbi:hypothetical protein HO173_000493 [Letharia columbiana]|uniref:non-specific serine/threonine protein kinase n=1 Tax=Letharia columbiana TaxID=112416 RepID=A0A8H6LAF0_9LECA|nr:uncharacterized protein HO173_000493 [Letharia columbiana]KAF6241781.1 hypothetical protein HO173_000493 [Letharia columbiana]
MPDRKNCAAKEFKNAGSMRQEVDMLKKVCQTFHKNIVQFVEEWHEDYKPLLVMEYVAGGNLQQRMKVRMEFEEIASLAGQALSALAFLHDQGVMHRDIKPANILCVTPNHYKLADFGVSRDITSLPSKQGTAEYMAPEVHASAPYSYEADIWSMPCCVWMQTNDYQREDALRHYSYLWEDQGGSEDSDAGSGANTPTNAHPNGSFSPKSPGSPEGDEAEEETSRNVHRDGEGTPEWGRQPQDFRNEAKTAIRGDSVYNPASAPPHPPSGRRDDQRPGRHQSLLHQQRDAQ